MSARIRKPRFFGPAFFILTLLGIIAGCEKNNNNDEDKPICVGGKGGSVSLIASLQHHGKPIISRDSYPDTVYVKFNTLEYPGSLQKFDTLVVAETGEDHVHISGLRCGKYFVFATGFDTTINQRVRGGVPVQFSVASGEVPVVVPVSE
jgi:hypothetical protein